jgi:hypothetical protein
MRLSERNPDCPDSKFENVHIGEFLSARRATKYSRLHSKVPVTGHFVHSLGEIDGAERYRAMYKMAQTPPFLYRKRIRAEFRSSRVAHVLPRRRIPPEEARRVEDYLFGRE